MADHLEANGDTYIELECLNTGKPYFITRNYADLPVANEYLPGHLSMIRREPVGVCALNPPWNYPLLISCVLMSAVLGTGNAVVMKPADPTPLSLLKLADTINEIFPKGVFNLIVGRGSEVGAALSSHSGVDLVQVTGSTQTGRTVLSQAVNECEEDTPGIGQ